MSFWVYPHTAHNPCGRGHRPFFLPFPHISVLTRALSLLSSPPRGSLQSVTQSLSLPYPRLCKSQKALEQPALLPLETHPLPLLPCPSSSPTCRSCPAVTFESMYNHAPCSVVFCSVLSPCNNVPYLVQYCVSSLTPPRLHTHCLTVAHLVGHPPPSPPLPPCKTQVSTYLPCPALSALSALCVSTMYLTHLTLPCGTVALCRAWVHGPGAHHLISSLVLASPRLNLASPAGGQAWHGYTPQVSSLCPIPVRL